MDGLDLEKAGVDLDERGSILVHFNFLKKAKEELRAQGVSFRAVELDQDAEGAALRARLGAMTGRTSVPSIWVAGDCIGGLNDGPGLLPLATAGALEPKLRTAGALQ